MSPDTRRTISIVSPCYNDAENVRICHAEVRALFDGPLAEFRREHIFADNASSDETVAVLAEIAAADKDVRVIFNARNVGVLRSTFNALQAASGDATVAMLAVDLQDPPEMIAKFAAEWKAGADVVYGVRAKRDEGAAMLALRGAFYRMMTKLANIPIPVDVGEFQMIDRRVREFVCRNQDHHPYIRGLIADAGFKRVGIAYAYRARARGLSKNRFLGLLDIAVNGILTFTRLPLRLLALAGAVLVAAGSATMLYGAFDTLQTFLVGLGLAVGGLNIVATGLVGEYTMMVHDQIRLGGAVPEKGRLNFEAKP